jgi:hypothetical protein
MAREFKSFGTNSENSRSQTCVSRLSRFGALLIGVLLAACLFGVTCAQTFVYFSHSGWRDNALLKGLVRLTQFISLSLSLS